MKVVLLLAAFTLSTTAQLQLASWDNSGHHGKPTSTTYLPSLSAIELSHPKALSHVISGTLTFPSASANGYEFNCEFWQTRLAFVWVDGHLVCQDNNAYQPDVNTVDNPLPIQPGQRLSYPIRVHVYGGGKLNIEWKNKDNSEENFSSIASGLSPEMTPQEVKRDELQKKSSHGWGNLLHHNMLAFTSLPAAVAVTLQLCQISTKKCITVATPDGIKSGGGEAAKAMVRPGPYAYDHSYGTFSFGNSNSSDTSLPLGNLTVSFSAGEENLSVWVAPDCAAASFDCDDLALRVTSRFMWQREGEIVVGGVGDGDGDGDNEIQFRPAGSIPDFKLTFTEPYYNVSTFEDTETSGGITSAVSFKLNKGAIGFTTDETFTFTGRRRKIEEFIAGKKHSHISHVTSKFNSDADDISAYLGVEAAAMWTAISTPAENGHATLMPVSRAWSRIPPTNSSDYTYAIFDWDNLFASLLASGDVDIQKGKQIAFSNIIQSFKSKTAEGYLANCAGGGYKDQDRTEPPVGAMVLLQLFEKYGSLDSDKWLIELVFDDIMDWSDWFVRTRLLPPLNALALRSWVEQSGTPGGMQLARYESGLDNTPMYDCVEADDATCEFFNATTGFMELYDVGMSSMFVQECIAMGKLGNVIGREKDSERMAERGRRMASVIRENLWDESRGVYANYFPGNKTFSERISPTSFYAMMLGRGSEGSGEEDDRRATLMVKNWLLSKDKFCVVSIEEDNTDSLDDDCYWGLPSITHDDPAYPALGYWRGFVWGPMAQLVNWSLLNFDHLGVVKNARLGLVKQMRGLFNDMWRKHGHVCENYLPHKIGTVVDGKVWDDECTGTTFYHWGALTASLRLDELRGE